MPSLLFPDTGTRLALLPDGGPAVGARGYLYEDAALTVVAEAYADVNGTKGALLPLDADGRRYITLDAYGRQVNYWGPVDGQDRLWLVVNGVSSPVDADYNSRLDAVAADAASGLAAKVAKGSLVFDIRDYGTTGTANDSATIALAVAAAVAAGGGEVLLPIGVTFGYVDLPTTVAVTLRGRGEAITTLKLPNGANRDVISHTSFASLTGTSSGAGVFRAALADMTIDGNKANNSSGYGVRWFGRSQQMSRLVIQNCASGGDWWEGNDNGAFAVPGDSLEATMSDIKRINNNGNGLTFKGPHDTITLNCVTWGNTGWGEEIHAPIYETAHNLFLNTLGSTHVVAGGAVQGSNCALTAAGVGVWGLLVESGAGVTTYSASVAACNGGVAVEYRSSHQQFHGFVANAATGIKLNGGSAHLAVVIFACDTYFNVSGQNGGSNVTAYTMDASGVLFSGTPSGSWSVTGAKTYTGIATSTIANATGYTTQLPASNSVLQIAGTQVPTYGTTVDIASNNGTLATITPTDGAAFTLAAPTSVTAGQRLTVRVRNTFGVLGAMTFAGGAGGYRTAGGWTQPANGFSRSITVIWDGAVWYEESRSAGDVAN